jgi:hypothetical protein
VDTSGEGKSDRYPRWLRQIPSLPLCLRDLLFRIAGPPATSTSVSVFPGPIWPCVISPSCTVKARSVPHRPSRLSRVLRQTPRPIIPLMGPLPVLSEPCGSAVVPLVRTANLTLWRRALAPTVLRSEISCHAGPAIGQNFGARSFQRECPTEDGICLRRHAIDLSRPRAVPRPEDPKPSALIAGPAHRAA